MSDHRHATPTSSWGIACSCGLVLAVAATATAQPANDSCGTPESFVGFGSVAFSTIGATTDGSPAIECNFFGQEQIYNDIWFRWTSDASTLVRLSLCESDYDTKIAVYVAPPKGACVDSSAILACNDDSCGLRSQATFPAADGETYVIRIGSYGTKASQGSTGNGIMLIESGVLADVTDPATEQRYLLAETGSWTDAEATAQLLGGHLASIQSQAENDFIQENFGFFDGVDRRLWIGFTDEGSEGDWFWSDGSEVDYTNWNDGEPNNAGDNEHFAEMLGSNGRWNDITDAGGSFPHLAVIEVGPGGGGPPGGCPGDFDGDGFVSGVDLGVLLSKWGGPGEADLDGDGIVSGIDLGIVLAAWGQCP
jgi:hypothetical protein